MSAFKTYLYVGNNPKLISGNHYNLRELSEVSGVNYYTLHTRVKRHVYAELTDDFLAVAYKHPPITRLHDKSTKMMAEWLRKPLTSIDPNYNPHKRKGHEL